MTNKHFLGMPIEGLDDRYKAPERVPQLSLEEVSALIYNVLEIPGVRGLAWSQYTPYYNDGDPCTFRAGEPYVSLVGLTDDNSDGYYEASWMEDDAEENQRYWISPYDDQFKQLIGNNRKLWSGDWPDRTWVWEVLPEDQPNPALFRAFIALEEAMDNDSCDHVLLDLFDDHATVIIDKESGKVVIHELEHD